MLTTLFSDFLLQVYVLSCAMCRADYQEGLLELQELYQTLEVKAAKMEQLLRLKDAKIAALTAKLQSAGLL